MIIVFIFQSFLYIKLYLLLLFLSFWRLVKIDNYISHKVLNVCNLLSLGYEKGLLVKLFILYNLISFSNFQTDKLSDGIHIAVSPVEDKKHIQDIMRRIPKGNDLCGQDWNIYLIIYFQLKLKFHFHIIILFIINYRQNKLFTYLYWFKLWCFRIML